ncbi:GntR family transcriptional regulator [uncultured Jannaschia sp.]|uniref:GntR family transcriptional regulator n=1 Tax=uncultured Jannaschia sp. TaxID=293347 RepID=UPI002631516F|nr:GntR family transcriptional regulator [uncultured Jannaschia sp.]
MVAGQKKQAVPLRKKILNEIRRSIATGELLPGSRLTERTISEAYGVSRTVAREVIRELEVERLGEMVPHRGLCISRLTPELVSDIYEIRTALELQITLRFTEVATSEEVARLRHIFTLLEAIKHTDRYEDIALRTAALTDYMVAVTRKRTAGEILHHLDTRITMLRILSLRNPGQTACGITLLDRIITAIERRGTAAVEVSLREYLAVASISAMAQLEREPSPAGARGVGKPA